MALTKEALEEVAKDFFEQTKTRLKAHWAAIPEQTKDDIEATVKFAARLAVKLAVGEAKDYEADNRHLQAQIAQIKGIGAFEVKHMIEEIIDTASRVAGTFFAKAVQQFLASQSFKL